MSLFSEKQVPSAFQAMCPQDSLERVFSRLTQLRCLGKQWPCYSGRFHGWNGFRERLLEMVKIYHVDHKMESFARGGGAAT